MRSIAVDYTIDHLASFETEKMCLRFRLSNLIIFTTFAIKITFINYF